VGAGCAGDGVGEIVEMYSYTVAGAITRKRMRIVRANGTVDKDVTYGYGSDGKLSTVLYPGGTIPYTYTYDFMDRPVKMTGPGFVAGNLMDQVKDVAYGVAGQVTSMKYLQGETEDYGSGSLIGVPYFFEEIKDFDPLYQMTRQRTTGRSAQGVFGTTLTDIEYVFPATGNNGRISRRKNNISGQDVSYGYDALNRLAGATNSGSGAWAQTFKHDGFGNLREQDATAGVAPDILLDVNMSNNRMSSAGWGYDANGNTTSMPVLGGGTATMGYDVDNRLVTWFKGTVGTEEYRYLPDNKRVWKKAPNGTETVYYYGAGGQKLATYTVQASPFALLQQSANVYFGGKLIRADGLAVVHDRLGSVMLQNGVQKDYFPYGDEIGTATAGNVDKFGTYHRDQTTGLDYADQRYFVGAMAGRFLTADPSEPGGLNDPLTLNWYSYVLGDPINYNDPEGLEVNVPVTDSPVPTCLSRVFREVITPSGFGTTNDDNAATRFFSSLEGTFGLSLFFEVRPNAYTTDSSSPSYQAALGVGFVYINRYVAQWGSESGFHSLEKVIMDASTPIWERGSGDSRQIRSEYKDKLYDILNGAPNDNKGDCDGLIWSLHLAQSMIAHSIGINHPLPRQLSVYNPVGNALAFHSFNNTKVPKGWDKRFRYTKSLLVPKFGGGQLPFHFFELPGVVLPTH